MKVQERLRNTDYEIDIALPGTDALIYEEAQTEVSWCAAGRAFGLLGPYEKVAARARVMAGTYARTYRRPWPLVEVDALDGSEAFGMAVEARQEKRPSWKITGWEVPDWAEVAAALGYVSAADAEKAARDYAARSGRDILKLRTAHFGKLVYDARKDSSDWSAIAKAVGFPYRHCREVASAYAKAAGLPWPPPPPPRDCGEAAYARRVEKKESWETIGETLGRDWEYARRAAKGYAERVGKPWPIPVVDYGPEAYRLRFRHNLPWDEVAERLHISRSWAVREANRHAADIKRPLPPQSTADVDETAYLFREQGLGWAEISERMKSSRSVALERAHRFAEAHGKPWPIVHPPVRKPSPKAKAAYERGYVAEEPWEEVATSLGYTSVASAKTSARCYADRHHLPLGIRRRRTYQRDDSRPGRAYDRKVADPSVTWEAIREALGYRSVQATHTAARLYAQRNVKAWPLPGDTDG